MITQIKNRQFLPASVVVKMAVMLLFGSLLSACGSSSFYHDRIMRGAVVDVNHESGQAVICIGTERNGDIGSSFVVNRVHWNDAGYEVGNVYELVEIGAITITERIGTHFAIGTVDRGDVQVHDLVMLEPD